MTTLNEPPTWNLGRSDFDAWVKDLIASGKHVIAPSDRGTARSFRALKSGDSVAFARRGKSTWSPKEHLFPKTETLFTYSVKGSDVEMADPEPLAAEQVLLGVRPCDAAGLCRLRTVLSPDPMFAHRSDLTTVVAFACAESDAECFCTAVGGSPIGREGVDLMIAASADGLVARAFTPKGQALVPSGKKAWKAAVGAAWEDVVASSREVEKAIDKAPVARAWAKPLEDGFASPVWSGLSESCIGCSICTYVCPSCSCFNVEDEGNASCGSRCRSWDSCSYGLFTVHGSGHNPRPDQASRLRQRVLHKFSYFQVAQAQTADGMGPQMCVGCGRCTLHCPVGIDIHGAVHAAMRATEAPHGK